MLSRTATSYLLFFGSPFVVGAIGASLIFIAFHGVPVLFFVWLISGLVASLGSAAGGMLHGDSDDRRTLFGLAGLLGGAVIYLAISAFLLLLCSAYVMVFKFV